MTHILDFLSAERDGSISFFMLKAVNSPVSISTSKDAALLDTLGRKFGYCSHLVVLLFFVYFMS